MAYDGFISYSHAADDRLAPALQQGLQRLAKRWNSRRALWIFRDETGLSTNPHLWSSIERTLDDSTWFILMASEDSAKSEWVNKEVIHWLATKSITNLLPVVTGGIWEWDRARHDFTQGSTAVPEALRGAFSDEPRHLDLRWARSKIDLDLRSSRFRSAVADLAAPMHGVAKDDLEGEDIRQHRRARRLARGGVIALVLTVVILVVVSVFAVSQRNGARAATAVSHQELLVAESQALLGSNRQLATLLAIEADRRQRSATTLDTLMNTIMADPPLQRTFGQNISGSDMAALANHRVVLLNADQGTSPNSSVLQVWNWLTGQRQPWPNAPRGDNSSGPVDISATSDGRLLAVLSRDGMIQIYSGRTLEPQGPAFPSGLDKTITATADITVSANGDSLAVTGGFVSYSPYAGASVVVFSHDGNEWISNLSLGSGEAPANAVSLSADGSVLATAFPTQTGSKIVVSDVDSGQLLFTFTGPPVASGPYSISLDWTHHRVVIATPNGGASDAVCYDLDSTGPVSHAINVGASAHSGAFVAYDPTDSRLGVTTSNGLDILDAATLMPLTTIPAGLVADDGAFQFVDSVHLLTSTYLGGPVTLADLSGTSVLATHSAARFNEGVYPYFASPAPNRSVGFSSLGKISSVTILGHDYKPLSPPISVEGSVPGMPSDGQDLTKPVVCADIRTQRIAAIGPATGDVVVLDSQAPFRVLSLAIGALTRVPTPLLCEWSPDGREIAIGTNPGAESAAAGATSSASVALYDVADKALVTAESVPDEAMISSLAYSPDSKTLWVGGASLYAGGENGSDPTGVYRLTHLGPKPLVTAAFPGATGISGDANGRRLVVTYQTSVRVFDTETLKPLTKPIAVIGSSLEGVDSSSNGHTAVVQSSQGWRFIDLQAQQPIGPWIPAPPFPAFALLGSDGTTVYAESTNDDGEIWNLAPSNFRSAACALAGRNFTNQEWKTYLSWAGTYRKTCPQFSSH